jgi:hypothetical protein
MGMCFDKESGCMLLLVKTDKCGNLQYPLAICNGVRSVEPR